MVLNVLLRANLQERLHSYDAVNSNSKLLQHKAIQIKQIIYIWADYQSLPAAGTMDGPRTWRRRGNVRRRTFVWVCGARQLRPAPVSGRPDCDPGLTLTLSCSVLDGDGCICRHLMAKEVTRECAGSNLGRLWWAWHPFPLPKAPAWLCVFTLSV